MGCGPSIEALSKDQATLCGTITSLYGTARIARSGLLNGKVTCSPDGSMTIESKEPEGIMVVPVK